MFLKVNYLQDDGIVLHCMRSLPGKEVKVEIFETDAQGEQALLWKLSLRQRSIDYGQNKAQLVKEKPNSSGKKVSEADVLRMVKDALRDTSQELQDSLEAEQFLFECLAETKEFGQRSMKAQLHYAEERLDLSIHHADGSKKAGIGLSFCEFSAALPIAELCGEWVCCIDFRERS